MNILLKNMVFAFGLCGSVVVAEVSTPQPGSAERKDIIDAVRVMAGYDLGGPIVFVVDQLEIEDGYGFLRGTATRPDGTAINISQSPLVTRDEIPEDFIDGSSVQAFVKQLGGHWYVDAYSVGATDVWWIGPPYCDNYSAFLPEAAC